jgi:hypothetical protein
MKETERENKPDRTSTFSSAAYHSIVVHPTKSGSIGYQPVYKILSSAHIQLERIRETDEELFMVVFFFGASL